MPPAKSEFVNRDPSQPIEVVLGLQPVLFTHPHRFVKKPDIRSAPAAARHEALAGAAIALYAPRVGGPPRSRFLTR